MLKKLKNIKANKDDDYGTSIFMGEQGSGKNISAINILQSGKVDVKVIKKTTLRTFLKILVLAVATFVFLIFSQAAVNNTAFFVLGSLGCIALIFVNYLFLWYRFKDIVKDIDDFIIKLDESRKGDKAARTHVIKCILLYSLFFVGGIIVVIRMIATIVNNEVMSSPLDMINNTPFTGIIVNIICLLPFVSIIPIPEIFLFIKKTLRRRRVQDEC